MQKVTANNLGGRAVGALFFTGFGALWMVLALYAKQWLSAETAAAVACGTAALAAGALWLMGQAKRLPREEEDPAVARAFQRINIVQWAAIAVVAFGFARLGIDAYVISAITAIVGLHLFPLARVFRYPLHHVTGAVLVGWAAASLLLFPRNELQGSTALGTGGILWLSAATTILLATRTVRAAAEVNG